MRPGRPKLIGTYECGSDCGDTGRGLTCSLTVHCVERSRQMMMMMMMVVMIRQLFLCTLSRML